MDDSNKSMYDMILVRDLHNYLELDSIFSKHVIAGDDGTYKSCTKPMVYLGYYNYI